MYYNWCLLAFVQMHALVTGTLSDMEKSAKSYAIQAEARAKTASDCE